jgi:predicted CopG family antitoxin
MATKTITIDLEAYGRLKRASFSQAIKRLVHPPLNVEAWLDRIRREPMSPEALEAVELAVALRRRGRRRTR